MVIKIVLKFSGIVTEWSDAASIEITPAFGDRIEMHRQKLGYQLLKKVKKYLKFNIFLGNA